VALAVTLHDTRGQYAVVVCCLVTHCFLNLSQTRLIYQPHYVQRCVGVTIGDAHGCGMAWLTLSFSLQRCVVVTMGDARRHHMAWHGGHGWHGITWLG
jgi:hypothetical protein